MRIVFNSIFVAITLVAGVGFSLPTSALVFGEGIVREANGDYLITYMSPDEGRLIQVRYVPPNKINPVVKSSFVMTDKYAISYRYQIYNQHGAQLAIDSFLFESLNSINVNSNQPAYLALAQPNSWSGHALANKLGKFRIFWIASNNAEIVTNKNQGGFGFFGNNLPGLGEAKLSGNSESPSFMGEPDEELVAQYDQLVKDTSFVIRNAAVPTIAIPNPFDPAVVLEYIQTHMHIWIGMQLLDAAFSAQLDRYFQSAISAYRLNQPKVGKKHLQTMRELIKKEQPDAGKEEDNDDKGDENEKTKRFLIDKLAARILDFDLKYVMKRMGGDKDE